MAEIELSPKELAEIGQRFHRFFRSRGLTSTEVGNMMGKSPSTLSRLVNGDRFSSDVLTQIQEVFPSIRLEWLLLNEGPMEDHVQRITGDYTEQLNLLRKEHQQLAQAPVGTTEKQVKERVAALTSILDNALDMRMRLLSEELDLFRNLPKL